MRERGGQYGPAFREPETKIELADEVLANELLIREARESGIDDIPEIRRSIGRILVQRLLLDRIDRQIDDHPPSDEDLKSYYARHAAEFAEEARWRPMIFAAEWTAPEEREAALERAGWVLKQVRESRDGAVVFGKLARTYSNHPSAPRGGDLNWVDRASAEKVMPRPVAEALLELDTSGACSAIVSEGNSFYLVLASSFRPGRTRSFDEARPEIRARVYKDSRATMYGKLIEELKKKYNARVDEQALERVQIPKPEPVSADGPPGFPVR